MCDCATCRPLADGSSDGFCLLAIVMTISHLAVVLASVVQASAIEPSAEGFEQIYQRKQKWWQKINREDNLHQTFYILGIGGNSRDRVEQVAISPAGLMGDVECVFTGHLPTWIELESKNFRTAYSRSGICIYLEALGSLTSDAALLRRIHVIPGHIAWHDRIFQSVWDCAPSRASPSVDQITFERDVEITPIFQAKPEAIQVKTLVSEITSGEGESLACYCKASLDHGDVLLRPGFITQYILRHSGLLSCKRREGQKMCEDKLAFKCTAITNGWGLQGGLPAKLSYPIDIACCIWTYYDDVARCIIIELESTRAFSQEEGPETKRIIFVRRKECIPCCTHSVREAGGRALQDGAYSKVLAHLI